MIYKRIKPQPALARFVDHYMFFSIKYDNSADHLIKVLPPLPEHGIEFLPKGLATIFDNMTGENSQESRTVLFGYPVFRKDFIMPCEDYVVIRVIFTPGSVFALLGGLTMDHFANRIVNAEEVIGGELRDVNQKLADESEPFRMIAIVEQYLHRKFKNTTLYAHPVDKVAAVLVNNPEKFSIDWLADQACLSPRQFNRTFTARMGIGPKTFGRMSRFHKAFSFKEKHPSVDWRDIVDRFRYTDYQHLSKDFTQFTGTLPPALMQGGNLSPEKMLAIDE
ncbi:MAG: helix-turn-helix domain-containing protein [Chryseolinea sp.]